MQREYILRNRHISCNSTDDQKNHCEHNPNILSPTVIALTAIKEMADNPETPDESQQPFSATQVESKEKPVVKIADFSAVIMEEKLNLLIVAINKMNTNFHHKFEDLTRQLNDHEKEIVPCLCRGGIKNKDCLCL